MDIQSRKLNFVQEFLRLDNEKLIKKLERILFQEKREFTNQILNLTHLMNTMLLSIKQCLIQNPEKLKKPKH